MAVNKPEPTPTKNNLPAVWDLVISDMKSRDAFGKEKYNTRLQPFNGRNSLSDAYEESLDMVVYLKQQLVERSLDSSNSIIVQAFCFMAMISGYDISIKECEQTPENLVVKIPAIEVSFEVEKRLCLLPLLLIEDGTYDSVSIEETKRQLLSFMKEVR